jgi:hypothetical protein
MPLSGGDRKHYARELARTERLHADLVKQTNAAYLAAHRLACEEWNARQFIGGPAEPSPAIGHVIDAGCTTLEVECRACRHRDRVNLRDLVWPKDKPVHTLANVLFCRPCRESSGATRRPNLVALFLPSEPLPPAASGRRA